MKVFINILLVLQLLSTSYGLYLLSMADLALNKSGIGNVDLWQEYNSEAGVLISFTAILWIITLLIVFISKRHKSIQSKIAFCMSPVVFFISWVIFWYV